MVNQRLVNEHTFKLAMQLVDVIRPTLRPEEVRDCVEEFVRVLKPGLETFHAEAERMRHRLNPSAN